MIGRTAMHRILALAAAGALLAACANAPAKVAAKEDYLANAGFNVLPADTPGYAAAVKQLPPHQFVHHTEKGVMTYYYLDPTGCGCLYYGSQANWDAYRQEMRSSLHQEAEQWLRKDDTPFTGQGGI
ncbi:MAG: hypothetical protein JSR21_12265 [Proteobacteria bacterium]|nr:hypothetical protein [Pseudomonadota bacterium]